MLCVRVCFQGKRRDLADRPELSLGSVDFAASQEYYNRPAMLPALMYAIDVSLNSVQVFCACVEILY